MRQLQFQVPRGRGKDAVRAALERGGVNAAVFEAVDADGPIDVVLATVPNGEVEPLLADVERLGRIRLTFDPSGALALAPPLERPPGELLDVTPRSPIEVFLAGLRSQGGWPSFLGYAVASGIVAWIGLFTGTWYLLTGAMLIAPFAGPAMNAAMATVSGDASLLATALFRYMAGIAAGAASALLLTLATGLRLPTDLMVDVASVSAVAIALPLAAGAVGALHLVQSEHSSLVSGAAVGMLVAASLAPPTGVVGMAPVMGRWDLVGSAAFLLVLQLTGINLTAAVLFRLYGMSSSGHRYGQGRPRLFPVGLVVTTLVLLGLVALQFGSGPALQRLSLQHQATEALHEEVAASGLGDLVAAEVRFVTFRTAGPEQLLAEVHVRVDRTRGDDADVTEELTRLLERRLTAADLGATPLVAVTVVSPGGP